MALMDYEKINLDLIESLIDFIVFGKHEVRDSMKVLDETRPKGVLVY